MARSEAGIHIPGDYKPVTISGTVTLPEHCRGLFCGDGGTVVFTIRGREGAVSAERTLTVQAGQFIPGNIVTINATGTTVTLIHSIHDD